VSSLSISCGFKMWYVDFGAYALLSREWI
jgi:hypothetical protein